MSNPETDTFCTSCETWGTGRSGPDGVHYCTECFGVDCIELREIEDAATEEVTP